MACRTLVPKPGIEPMPSAVKVLSLNHWTTREASRLIFRKHTSSLNATFLKVGFCFYRHFSQTEVDQKVYDHQVFNSRAYTEKPHTSRYRTGADTSRVTTHGEKDKCSEAHTCLLTGAFGSSSTPCPLDSLEEARLT